MNQPKKTEFLIGGFTLRNEACISSLLLGIKEDSAIIYAGTSARGFESDEQQHKLLALLKPLLINFCPFNSHKDSGITAHWVKPILVCEVNVIEPGDLPLQNPEFLWLREDKNINEHLNKI